MVAGIMPYINLHLEVHTIKKSRSRHLYNNRMATFAAYFGHRLTGIKGIHVAFDVAKRALRQSAGF